MKRIPPYKKRSCRSPDRARDLTEGLRVVHSAEAVNQYYL